MNPQQTPDSENQEINWNTLKGITSIAELRNALKGKDRYRKVFTPLQYNSGLMLTDLTQLRAFSPEALKKLRGYTTSDSVSYKALLKLLEINGVALASSLDQNKLGNILVLRYNFNNRPAIGVFYYIKVILALINSGYTDINDVPPFTEEEFRVKFPKLHPGYYTIFKRIIPRES